MRGGIKGNPNAVTTSVASGIWPLNSQAKFQRKGVWPFSFPVDYLVVAGGGGGRNYGGGGGGQVLSLTAQSLVSGGSYTVTVGSGGPAETDGNNSVFSTTGNLISSYP